VIAGGVLRDAWDLYRADFARYVAIAALAFAVLNVVDLLAGEAGSGGGLAAALVVTVGSFVAYAALVHGGRQDVRTGAAVAEAYGATGRRLGPILVASLVSTLGIAVGALLFILPGIYLAVRWSLVIQAIMLEGTGWQRAFGRSAELVRGHFWPMLAVVAVTAAASVAAVLLPLAAEAWLPLPDWLSGWVVGVAADSLAFPYFALLFNAAHAQLTAPDET
jgi:hypothetical protein